MRDRESGVSPAPDSWMTAVVVAVAAAAGDSDLIPRVENENNNRYMRKGTLSSII